jgi:four helix bundle protein
MSFLFEKLDVYQKSLDFAERIESICNQFPKGNAHLADQMRRASLSIALNIAEGNGRWHKKERKNFFLIARGSAFECVPLVEIARRKGFISKELSFELKEKLEEISRMLSALARDTEKDSD